MKLSEKVDHLLRQYNYKRKRESTNNRSNNDFEMDRYFSELDAYIDQVMEGINKFLPKG